MKIEKGDNRFYIPGKEGTLAHITFRPEDKKTIIAVSTFVAPSMRGQGIAKKLLDRLAEHARENNLKIRPQCSYVVTAFEEHEEYKDVKAG